MVGLKDKRIHFIGIGGVGVNALAKFAAGCGAKVSGSDAKLSALCHEIAGAKVYEGIEPEAVDDMDMVVYSSAIKPTHPELARARELSIPTLERQEFLHMVASGFERVVGIAGTHGKTTTTAMLTHILYSAGKKFVGMIGGSSVDYGNFVNNSFGARDIFVVEACEYKRNFLTLNPMVALVTNVECDHPDCYSDFASVRQAFDEYLSSAPCRIYLKSDDGEHFAIARDLESGSAIFSAELLGDGCLIYKEGEYVGKVILRDGGVYNYKNAAFAVVAADALGVEPKDAISALATFGGVLRRFENTGTICGAPVYFDFAHHPTEIGCVLRRAGERGKILAIFQPHTYSRTKAYFADFVDVLGGDENIDTLILMPTYAAREKFDAEFESDALARAILEKYGKNVILASDMDVIELVSRNAKSHDVILFIGAGDIYDLKDKLKYD